MPSRFRASPLGQGVVGIGVQTPLASRNSPAGQACRLALQEVPSVLINRLLQHDPSDIFV